MQFSDATAALSKFRQVNKFEAFREIIPEPCFCPPTQQEIVSHLLDTCCSQLLLHLKECRRPRKFFMREVLIECMDALSIAPLSACMRDFGYQLGWFLAQKVAVDLKKNTEKKVWSYWQINDGEVSVPLRPRISRRAREKQRPTESHRKQD